MKFLSPAHWLLLYIHIHTYDTSAPSVRASGARGRNPLIQRLHSGYQLTALHVVEIFPDLVSSSLASAARNTVVLTKLTRFF